MLKAMEGTAGTLFKTMRRVHGHAEAHQTLPRLTVVQPLEKPRAAQENGLQRKHGGGAPAPLGIRDSCSSATAPRT